ncbi:uncharacterized protein LOC122976641 [Thunnus albacares]|uniref:uncharacterized protein LOC122976641 n=1 Tax=Thunnus albacares TaxID=8236 RepID=UPI001CF7192D|nr:uncharacterized protein LOC122976641 [Thunnus albacares]
MEEENKNQTTRPPDSSTDTEDLNTTDIQILAGQKMATPPEVLLECLEDLGSEDFERFKWYLCQRGVLEGFKAIPNGRLEKANRFETVDLMVGKYCEDAIKVTRMILGKIDRNDLVKCLSNTISKPSELPVEEQESDRQGEMEKEQTDSESKREEPPLTTGPSVPSEAFVKCQHIFKSNLKKRFQFLEHVLKSREGGELPKTLTEMYLRLVVVQTKVKNVKPIRLS